ncbi:MAG: hypothetical protein NTZ97_02525 [Candidatus Moranbacteria bacterium]|nr:hypothetical protein [Candidatus Moranbacteria bacterium]
MEKDEKQKEEESQDDDMDMEEGKMKQWLQDNMRIIISVIIVVAIAGGIYSYSKRTEAPTSEPSETPVLEEINNGISTEETTTPAEKPAPATQTKPVVKPATPAAVSQETENSFVETASKGDGTTHLARRALANYLEKNPDSTLTAEHKIYIEDFLRKNVAKKGVRIGTTVEFSKDLIQNAITKSKTLNQRQLQNLHKYAVRVPSLS